MVHFVNSANQAFLSAMELSVHKEITCKRQNHSFLFNKYTYHDRHLTKNGRQLELVPVLLLSLVDALLGERLSKTDISSVYRAGPTGFLLRALSIPNVRTGRPDNGRTGHFENETGFFQEF